MQAYSDPSRESDEYALPDLEVFYMSEDEPMFDGESWGIGWYWQACFPGCLPDGDPIGPFGSPEQAIADARASNA